MFSFLSSSLLLLSSNIRRNVRVYMILPFCMAVRNSLSSIVVTLMFQRIQKLFSPILGWKIGKKITRFCVRATCKLHIQYTLRLNMKIKLFQIWKYIFLKTEFFFSQFVCLMFSLLCWWHSFSRIQTSYSFSH